MARKQSPAQRRASLANLRKARAARGGKRKVGSNPPRRHRRRQNPPPDGGRRTAVWRARPVKRRKYSYGSSQKRVIRTNSPRRGRRRGYQGNPGFSISGIIGQVTGAGKMVAGIYSGKAATNYLTSLIPASMKLSQPGPLNYAAKLGVGIVGTMAVRRFVGPEFAKAFLAGSLMAILDPMVKNLPVIGAALGDDDMGEYVPVGYDYPQVGESVPVGAYETSVGAYETSIGWQ